MFSVISCNNNNQPKENNEHPYIVEQLSEQNDITMQPLKRWSGCLFNCSTI